MLFVEQDGVAPTSWTKLTSQILTSLNAHRQSQTHTDKLMGKQLNHVWSAAIKSSLCCINRPTKSRLSPAAI